MLALVALLSLVVIQFDGSFRKPSDPGYSTEGLPAIGSAAACLFYLPDVPFDETNTLRVNYTNSIEPLAMVQMIAPSSQSAEIEYEGAINAIAILHAVTGAISVVHSEARRYPVAVQGDCKTVIEQMQGKARARKLSSLYEKAKKLLDVLPFDVRFTHIPRSHNFLPDLACQRVREKHQVFVFTGAWASFYNVSNDVITGNRKNVNTELTRIMNAHVGSEITAIPYSSRLDFYRSIAVLAYREDLDQWLYEVGQRIVQESNLLVPINPKGAGVFPSKLNANDRAEAVSNLVAEGVQYQIWALHAMSEKRSADKLWQQYRWVMSTRGELLDYIKECILESRVECNDGCYYLPPTAKRDRFTYIERSYKNYNPRS
jgi:predicted CoA-binding protein